MNVLIISRCTKRAREQSCRIIDQFAERTGDAAWQTTITMEGVVTLRKLLRKTARRNTAVACHWLKNGQTELLWIVGNLRRFNAQGRVPTNRTTLQVIRNDGEHRWQSAESIALLAAIAGLFHDFGKAGCASSRCSRESQHVCQPYRHEWISVRLFEAFVGERSDEQWLTSLTQLKATDEKAMLKALKRDTDKKCSLLEKLPPLAKVVVWLILSHHRLPQSHSTRPELLYCEGWFEKQLNADWNALNHKSTENISGKSVILKCLEIPHGTPLKSQTRREKARQIGKRIRNLPALLHAGSLDNLFTLHLARLSLMLADHVYSSQPAYAGWQDDAFHAWANSYRGAGELKQKLDEHIVGVAHQALLMGRSLPALRRSLPAIARHKTFRERAKEERFDWQNKARDVASSLREKSAEQGFFGISMASTGCGKTFANARIMYALADEQAGCRFSVALGLRTLTLQTGRLCSRVWGWMTTRWPW